jgi:CO/xanthine dehydrogenase Mo-binding subunit
MTTLRRADDTPMAIGWQSHPAPARNQPLRVDGCGEVGYGGAMTPVMKAVVDALSAHGIRHFDKPATPHISECVSAKSEAEFREPSRTRHC